MNVAQLRTILDHLPDDLPVMLPSGECWRVNRGAAHRGQAVWLAGAITTPGEVRLSGRFRDQRTLDVRLARLEAM